MNQIPPEAMNNPLARAFLEEVAKRGADWVVTLLKSHRQDMLEKSRANAYDFLIELGQRLDRLEAALSETQKRVFEAALSHPSTGLLIEKAYLTAATTHVPERHRILAQLIAERLTAGPDETITLAGNVAADVIAALSPRQIRLLGVMATITSIRPKDAPTPATQEEYDEYAERWWNENLGPLMHPTLQEARPVDFGHLVGLSCIYLGAFSYIPPKIFSIEPKPSPGTMVTMSRLEDEQWWPIFAHLWRLGMEKAVLTSIGQLIGTLHHDEVFGGTPTIFVWDETPS